MVLPTPPENEPLYTISIVSRMVGLSIRTLRYYERLGLVEPPRPKGRIRLYTPRDVQRLRRIRTLKEDLGLTAAGVEVALRLMERIQELEGRLAFLQREMSTRRPRSRAAPQV